MITKKRFSSVDGVTSRFLSDFIIQSEQFARVYVYFYNPAGIEGDIDPGTGLPTRVADFPNPAEDLVNLDKWDLVDNSILFYTEPVAGSSVYIEVATTPEEFGDTLTAPAVERAEVAAEAAEASAAAALVSETNAAASETAAGLSETNAALSETNSASSAAAALVSEINSATSEANASTSETNSAASAAAAALSETNSATSEANASTSETNAQLYEWETEAERLTADSYATEAEDVLVNLVTSDGDGTFTYTPQAGTYSSLHWAAKAATFNPVLYALLTGATFTGQVKGIAPVSAEDLTRKDYVDTALALKAPLVSPALTGTPTAPTAAPGTDTTQIATTAFVLANGGGTGILSTDNFFHAQDEKVSGSAGGGSSAGFQDRVLNTVKTNTISGASLAANVITLPAGDYYIEASAPAYRSNGHAISIYNQTDATYDLLGSNAYAATTDTIDTHSFVKGTLSLASTKDITLRHYISSAQATTGLGDAVASGNNCVFAEIRIWKVG